MIVVTGAGGFIGHHLVKALKAQGDRVRGVDLKLPEFEQSPADQFLIADLRDSKEAFKAIAGASEVWMLAASMGGMGYIEGNDADILRDNLLIDVNTVDAAHRKFEIKKIVYASSACVYPGYAQATEHPFPLREEAVFPADPQHGYGWEKLTAEKLLTAYHEAGRIDVRIARLHAIYGPLGTWQGGREKAPAALCRKAAEAPDGGEVEVWGDGQQTRSFCYVDDCVEGLLRLAASDYPGPVNIGSSESVPIDELASLAIYESGKDLTIRHVPGPQGVRGRVSDNSLCREVLGWEPTRSLDEGMTRTYAWVAQQVATRAVTA